MTFFIKIYICEFSLFVQFVWDYHPKLSEKYMSWTFRIPYHESFQQWKWKNLSLWLLKTDPEETWKMQIKSVANVKWRYSQKMLTEKWTHCIKSRLLKISCVDRRLSRGRKTALTFWLIHSFDKIAHTSNTELSSYCATTPKILNQVHPLALNDKDCRCVRLQVLQRSLEQIIT